MANIHNRMPVILDKKSEEIWLNKEIEETEKLTAVLTPYNNEEMEAYQISKRVNSPGNNDERISIPI